MNNSIGENAKRVMAKAVIDEVLHILDSNESSTLTQDEIYACIDRFISEPSEEKLQRTAADDTTGKDIKERFWDMGNISCGGMLILRNVCESDREGFLRLQREYSSVRSLLRDDEFCTKIWEEHNDNAALMLSISKNEEYIGYCGIKDLSKRPWEIAVELLPEQTHKGIGFAAVSAMLDALKARLGVTQFRVRIDPTNITSQSLFEKLGAKPNGISEFLLHGEKEIRECEELNLHLIDDSLIAVAKKFSVEPKALLSHVLEYSLQWGEPTTVLY